MIILLATISILIYSIYTLVCWWIWLHKPIKPAPKDDPDNATEDIREIHANGHVYTSPIKSESENDTFEWDIKRFRVEGERLIEDKNFGNNAKTDKDEQKKR